MLINRSPETVSAGGEEKDNQLRLLRALVRYRHWARSPTYDESRALYEFIDAVSDAGRVPVLAFDAPGGLLEEERVRH